MIDDLGALIDQCTEMLKLEDEPAYLDGETIQKCYESLHEKVKNYQPSPDKLLICQKEYHRMCTFFNFSETQAMFYILRQICSEQGVPEEELETAVLEIKPQIRKGLFMQYLQNNPQKVPFYVEREMVLKELSKKGWIIKSDYALPPQILN